MKKNTSELTNHPINADIYNDAADAELIASVKAHGVLNPILIDHKNRIISGHRRFDAACKAGLDEVPVEIFESNDELQIQEALIESNRQRVKSNEQIAREAARLFQIEKEKAKIRQSQANTKIKDVPAISPGDSGDTRAIVAKKLGVGAKKVDQAVAVVAALEELKRNGDHKEAEVLREALNGKSINFAYSVAQASGLSTAAQPLAGLPPVEAKAVHEPKLASYGRVEHEVAIRRIEMLIDEEIQRCPDATWSRQLLEKIAAYLGQLNTTTTNIVEEAA
ncbi:MAG: ParB family transcriptional regulator, chromosome partitioning protein [Verrucomicrobiota bacterium]